MKIVPHFGEFSNKAVIYLFSSHRRSWCTKLQTLKKNGPNSQTFTFFSITKRWLIHSKKMGPFTADALVYIFFTCLEPITNLSPTGGTQTPNSFHDSPVGGCKADGCWTQSFSSSSITHISITIQRGQESMLSLLILPFNLQSTKCLVNPVWLVYRPV